MICDICKSRNASVHVRKMSAGAPADYYLCTECAVKFGYAKKVNRFSPDEAAQSDGALRCKCCGCSLSDIVSMGGIGCSECYTTFREKITDAVRRIHGTSQYSGHIPSGASRRVRLETKINQARAQLAEAIEQENFEQAAVLRDYIRNLENGTEAGAAYKGAE